MKGKESTDIIHRADDSPELMGEVSALFKSFFGEVLSMLSLSFPHTKGDCSENEQKYNCLRSRILRHGNDKIRVMPEIFGDFSVERTRYTEKKEIRLVREPYKIKD